MCNNVYRLPALFILATTVSMSIHYRINLIVNKKMNEIKSNCSCFNKKITHRSQENHIDHKN